MPMIPDAAAEVNPRVQDFSYSYLAKGFIHFDA